MKKYILINGGGLSNKGAQSMTFVKVNEIRNRYPDKEIILLSDKDYKRGEEEKDLYSL